MVRIGLFNRHGNLYREFEIADDKAEACSIIRYEGRWFALRPTKVVRERHYYLTSVHKIEDAEKPKLLDYDPL